MWWMKWFDPDPGREPGGPAGAAGAIRSRPCRARRPRGGPEGGILVTPMARLQRIIFWREIFTKKNQKFPEKRFFCEFFKKNVKASGPSTSLCKRAIGVTKNAFRGASPGPPRSTGAAPDGSGGPRGAPWIPDANKGAPRAPPEPSGAALVSVSVSVCLSVSAAAGPPYSRPGSGSNHFIHHEFGG